MTACSGSQAPIHCHALGALRPAVGANSAARAQMCAGNAAVRMSVGEGRSNVIEAMTPRNMLARLIGRCCAAE